jgi:hypothetical protein
MGGGVIELVGGLLVLYCFVFLYIACRGGGGYSVGRGSTA